MILNRDWLLVTLAWGPEYYAAALKLRASAERFGLATRIVQVPGFPPSRREAWRLRGRMILDALEKDGGPVLMVDADALVERDPRPYLELARRADLGAFEFSPELWWACTLAARKTAGAIRCLERWQELMDTDDWDMDSILLGRAIQETRPAVARLSSALAWWEPAMGDRFGHVVPVIRQLGIGAKGLVA